MASTSTMREPSAAICRLMGWTVGDILESHDPPGRIRLTVIGDGLVLRKTYSANRRSRKRFGNFTFATGRSRRRRRPRRRGRTPPNRPQLTTEGNPMLARHKRAFGPRKPGLAITRKSGESVEMTLPDGPQLPSSPARSKANGCAGTSSRRPTSNFLRGELKSTINAARRYGSAALTHGGTAPNGTTQQPPVPTAPTSSPAKKSTALLEPGPSWEAKQNSPGNTFGTWPAGGLPTSSRITRPSAPTRELAKRQAAARSNV